MPSPARQGARRAGRESGIAKGGGTVNRSIPIAGMSGLAGTAVRKRLEPRARLAALNRGGVPGFSPRDAAEDRRG